MDTIALGDSRAFTFLIVTIITEVTHRPPPNFQAAQVRNHIK